MNNKNATCPQCGAQGTAGKFCEFCGTKIPVPVVANSQDTTSEKNMRRIIPFNPEINEDCIKSMTLEKLVDTNYVPLDVFDKMEEFKVVKIFAPMYNFTGSFQSSWSCTQVIEIKRQREVYKNGEKRTETYYENEYHPASGIATGQFDILCSSDPELMKANSYNYQNFNNSVLYDDSLVDEDATLIPFTKEKLISWNSVAKEIIEDLAFSAAYRQAPTPNERFSQSASWNKDSEGTEVYVPIWAVSFKYEGNTYGAFLRGDRPNAYEIRIPTDKNAENHVDEVRKKKRDGCLLSMGIFLLFALIIGGWGFFYWWSHHRWGTFLELPGQVIIVCSLIAIYVIGTTNKHVSKRNKEIDEYINDIHQNTKLIRQANAKRVYNFGDSETNASNIDINSLQEPQKASLALAWITMLVMSVVLWFCYIGIPAYDRAKRARENAELQVLLEEKAQKRAIIKNDKAKKLAESIQSKIIKVKGGLFEVPGSLGATVNLTDFCIMKVPITDKEWKLLEEGKISPKTVDDFIKQLNKVSSCSFSLPTLMQWQYASEHSALKKVAEQELCKDLYASQNLSWSDYNGKTDPEGPSYDSNRQSSSINRTSHMDGKFTYYISEYSEYLDFGIRLVMKK